MPKGENVPLGLDEPDFLPCGCSYQESMLEQWMVEKKMISGEKKKVKHVLHCYRAHF